MKVEIIDVIESFETFTERSIDGNIIQSGRVPQSEKVFLILKFKLKDERHIKAEISYNDYMNIKYSLLKI